MRVSAVQEDCSGHGGERPGPEISVSVSVFPCRSFGRVDRGGKLDPRLARRINALSGV